MEKLGKYQELIETIDVMIQPQRKNPFPTLSFLIEDRAYYDTSHFLVEYREKIVKKMSEHVINSDSVSFDFK